MIKDVSADLKQFFSIENRRQTRLRGLRKVRRIVFSGGFNALLLHRIENRFGKSLLIKRLFPIRYLLVLFLSCLRFLIGILYGIRIERSARIGKGMFIDHFGGIHIGKCRIGDNCIITQQVSIGQRDAASCERYPRIGDRVWIGPHARIRGDIKIGSGVTIASGSVVCADIQENALVMGNPARVIRKNYDNRFLF